MLQWPFDSLHSQKKEVILNKPPLLLLLPHKQCDYSQQGGAPASELQMHDDDSINVKERQRETTVSKQIRTEHRGGGPYAGRCFLILETQAKLSYLMVNTWMWTEATSSEPAEGVCAIENMPEEKLMIIQTSHPRPPVPANPDTQVLLWPQPAFITTSGGRILAAPFGPLCQVCAFHTEQW